MNDIAICRRCGNTSRIGTYDGDVDHYYYRVCNTPYCFRGPRRRTLESANAAWNVVMRSDNTIDHTKITELQTNLAMQLDYRRTAGSMITELKAKIAKLEAENTRLQNQFSANFKLKVDLKALRAENATLESQLTKWSSDLTRLQNQLADRVEDDISVEKDTKE